MRGLPDSRKELDALAKSLCDRLASAGPAGIESDRLVEEMGLGCTRTLRLLVAYCRVWHHRHEILGVPGDRYYWGEHSPLLYDKVKRQCRQMGRCYFFISALIGRHGPAMAAAQLVFDFMDLSQPHGRENDDLASLVAASNTRIEDVLDALAGIMSQTDQGREALARFGSRNREVLLDESELIDMVGQLDQLRERMVRADRRGQQEGPADCRSAIAGAGA